MQPLPFARMSDRSSLYDPRNCRSGGGCSRGVGDGAMDTRSKILTEDRSAEANGRVVLVIGTFDVLRAAHVRELGAIRERIGKESTLVAAILPGGHEWFPARARAELVAAVRMIDYVVIAAGGE